jgi:hypothetical protein
VNPFAAPPRFKVPEIGDVLAQVLGKSTLESISGPPSLPNFTPTVIFPPGEGFATSDSLIRELQQDRLHIDDPGSPGEGGPGGPGVAGSTTAGIGLPGVGPTDGTVTGGGALSAGPALAMFGSGLGQGGAIGQAIEGLTGNTTGNSLAATAATTLLSMATGAPGLPLTIANSLLGGLIKLADAAQRSVGPRGPSTTLADVLRNRVDEPVAPPTSGDPTANPPDVPEGTVSVGIGGVPGTPGTVGPVGEVGVVGEGAPAGPTGGDSPASGPAGSSGEFFHGGPVRGRAGRDKIPARLTRGEYVIDPDSARRFGPLVQALNAWEPRR